LELIAINSCCAFNFWYVHIKYFKRLLTIILQ
jgi:Fe-S-cluster containining protein